MNGGNKFWGDLSRKTGTWAAVATLAAVVVEWLDNEPFDGWEHVAAIGAAAAIRAVVGLVQGNVGDRSKATFKAAEKPPAGRVAADAVADPEDV